MTLDKLKCCRHHTIVESDLTAKHLEWQIAKKEEDQRQRLYSYSSLYHSTVRKIVLMKGLKPSRRATPVEKKRRDIFFDFHLEK